MNRINCLWQIYPEAHKAKFKFSENKKDEIEKIHKMIDVLIEMEDLNEIQIDGICDEDMFHVRMIKFNVEDIKIEEIEHIIINCEYAIEQFCNDWTTPEERIFRAYASDVVKTAEEDEILIDIIYNFHEEIKEQIWEIIKKDIKATTKGE